MFWLTGHRSEMIQSSPSNEILCNRIILAHFVNKIFQMSCIKTGVEYPFTLTDKINYPDCTLILLAPFNQYIAVEILHEMNTFN